MLTRTFIHLQGIGNRSEQELWHSGFHTWDELIESRPPFISPARWEYYKDGLAESRRRLSAKPSFFSKTLPARELWRIFPHFRPVTAYLDIETSGLGTSSYITTIAVYDGSKTRVYVQGENLDDFPADIMEYDVLVTYNGKTFDVPVIEQYFDMVLPQAHIDLRYILNSLGFKGGLKKCEQMLGLDRGDLDGVDGYTAVILWNTYRETGNRKALETLIAYNIRDSANLETLMVEAFNRHLQATPFYATLKIPVPVPVISGPEPDLELLRKLLDRQTSFLRY
ncbi:MAG: ribonuclease H-like domain-containing protein [Proteobacteria bacterium]|nr:ribonuclease H-like domain-containing protein [Pseudomonadota bacterium]MBU1739470.1 ribonuclease H-like domain-containing protein [Pseudomonadota bacterium]